MRILVNHELNVQNKIYNLTKYSLIFFVFCTLSMTLINSHENIGMFGLVFSVICIPLAFISLSHNLIKPDIEDGTLENMLVTFSSIKIITAKYVALCLCTIASFCLIAPFIYVIYSVETQAFILMISSALLLLLLSAALIVLIGAIQGYFRTNTNFLSILIMPLIVPNIILSGILIQAPENIQLLTIMAGVDLLIIPPALYLSSYLVENIYNI